MKDKFYIYAHINISTDEVFYIGKGCGRRAKQKTNRNKYWTNIVNKYDYDILFLEEGLTQEKALDLEIFYIKKFGRRDLNIGTLVNMTDGGEHIVNYVRSDEWRKQHSIFASQSKEYRRKEILVLDEKNKLLNQLLGQEAVSEFYGVLRTSVNNNLNNRSKFIKTSNGKIKLKYK